MEVSRRIDKADHQFLKEMDDTTNANDRRAERSGPRTAPPVESHTAQGSHERFRPIHARAASTPLGGGWRSSPNSPARPNERSHLIRSYSTADVEGSGESMEYTGSGPVAGGTIMGIHNLAIVFPQFIVSCMPIHDFSSDHKVAIVASIIFKLADTHPDVQPTERDAGGKNGVAWVLRFGGLMALVS